MRVQIGRSCDEPACGTMAQAYPSCVAHLLDWIAADNGDQSPGSIVKIRTAYSTAADRLSCVLSVWALPICPY